MRALQLIIGGLLGLAGIVVVCVVLLLLLFGISSSRAEQANGRCSMMIIEKKIEPISIATDYRRACMASEGYGMQANCYVDNYSVASCFIPRWMFWINTI